jgi:hypothetical protein
MKRQKICPICNNALKKGEAAFAFPRLPASSRYSKLTGIVHVMCLNGSPEAENIRKELTEVLGHSPYPLIQQEGNILILNHERDKCLVIYDFEDFAVFPIHYHLIDEILNTQSKKELNLDVNGFLKLSIDNNLELNILKPFSEEKIALSSLSLKRLKKMLGGFPAEKKAEEGGRILIEEMRQLFIRQTADVYKRKQNIAVPNSLLSLKNDDKKFLNNI